MSSLWIWSHAPDFSKVSTKCLKFCTCLGLFQDSMWGGGRDDLTQISRGVKEIVLIEKDTSINLTCQLSTVCVWKGRGDWS